MFRSRFAIGRPFLVLGILALLANQMTHAHAQIVVKEVFVGLTPNCPNGFSACWPFAREALRRMDGVEPSIADPDIYNSTVQIDISKPQLPDIAKWRQQFSGSAGEAYEFRGIEITVYATLEEVNRKLQLRAANSNDILSLAPLKHKLQWNWKMNRERKAEPDEAVAYDQLLREKRAAMPDSIKVMITGPLNEVPLSLEVREFIIVSRE